MEYERAGAAKRRRERRLRSWWRHERMTVAMELAVATHHSSPKGGWPGATHDALRGQTKASSGRRPGVLKEPEPPVVVEHAACPCSGAPLLVVPSLASAESDGVDGTSLKYLLKLALQKKKEEEVRKKREEEQRLVVEEEKKAKKALAAWTARRKAVTDEMHALLGVSRLTPAQREREVALIRELDVIDAAMPPSLPMKRKKRRKRTRRRP